MAISLNNHSCCPYFSINTIFVENYMLKTTILSGNYIILHRVFHSIDSGLPCWEVESGTPPFCIKKGRREKHSKNLQPPEHRSVTIHYATYSNPVPLPVPLSGHWYSLAVGGTCLSVSWCHLLKPPAPWLSVTVRMPLAAFLPPRPFRVPFIRQQSRFLPLPYCPCRQSLDWRVRVYAPLIFLISQPLLLIIAACCHFNCVTRY